MPAYSIGIDLGTTHSCVAVLIDGEVVIVPNEQGSKTTPSFVAYRGDAPTVGGAAQNSITQNPTGTIYDAKRLIGKKFSDASVQKDIEMWPFKVEADEHDNPVIVAVFKDKDDNKIEKRLSPTEISSFILKNLKERAGKYLKQEVKHAVITVPAYFNEEQRE